MNSNVSDVPLPCLCKKKKRKKAHLCCIPQKLPFSCSWTERTEAGHCSRQHQPSPEPINTTLYPKTSFVALCSPPPPPPTPFVCLVIPAFRGAFDTPFWCKHLPAYTRQPPFLNEFHFTETHVCFFHAVPVKSILSKLSSKVTTTVTKSHNFGCQFSYCEIQERT